MASDNQQNPTRLRWLVVTGVVLLAALVIVVVFQFLGRRPEPVRPQLPAAPQTMDLMGTLMMAKSICEGQARIARKAAQRQLIPPSEAILGAKLYTETKSALDDCLTLLRGYLDQKGSKEDRPRLEAQLAAAAGKMTAFFEWSARVQLPKYFDAPPLNEAHKGLDDWLARVKANEAMLPLFTSSLEAARMISWEDLSD